MAAIWTILLADDDPKTRHMIRGMIERQLGLIVTEAADGTAALEVFKQSQADLVLLDASMPRMDGFAVCRKIRALAYGVDVPIIMVTSLSDSDSVKRAMAAGATDYVAKPVNCARLSQLIQQHLGSSTAVPAE
jgi:CheY-like chemotaxis protein